MNRKRRRAVAKVRRRGAPAAGGSRAADARLREAVAHLQAGRLAEAEPIYVDILAGDAEHVVALRHYGVIHIRRGDPRRAAELIGKAIALRPDYAEAHDNMGVALKAQGELEAAVAAHRRALALKPDFARARNNLGNALKNQGKLDDTVAEYRTALELKPDYAEALNNLGNALSAQRKPAEAVAILRKLVALNPDVAGPYNNLGNALKAQGRLSDAVAAYRKALALDPDFAEAHNNLGYTFEDQGRLGEAVAAFRKALEIKPGMAAVHSNLIFCMNYDGTPTQADIWAETLAWNAVHAAPFDGSDRSHANDPNPDRRLRVGYVSPDFCEHSVGHFLAPLIAAHDRRAFEAVCYAQVANPDQMTTWFRGRADAWRSIVGLPDSAVADIIRVDGIDILVDVAGHTANNRLLMFAVRPAPVQVTWLGYPNTTGVAAIDYRLTDAIADPVATDDSLHSETMVRLANGFLCYAPSANAPDVGRSPAQAAGHVTFGSFNKLAKVTPEVVGTWAEVLDAVANSRMLIKNRTLADKATRQRYLQLFGARGIDPGRIELLPWIASNAGHLGAYHRVDIGLDTFPYNGTTTTCEALWMGVPVVTLAGDRHAGRVGASLLARIGHPEFVAETEVAYVAQAVRLAGDLEKLALLRSELRDRVRQSPLCRQGAFAREIEGAYREMWRRFCADA